jgi:hypothetical protein
MFLLDSLRAAGSTARWPRWSRSPDSSPRATHDLDDDDDLERNLDGDKVLESRCLGSPPTTSTRRRGSTKPVVLDADEPPHTPVGRSRSVYFGTLLPLARSSTPSRRPRPGRWGTQHLHVARVRSTGRRQPARVRRPAPGACFFNLLFPPVLELASISYVQCRVCVLARIL